MTAWADLECELSPSPRFYVEPVPAKPMFVPKGGDELQRQKAFIGRIRKSGAPIRVWASVNAGARGPAAMRQAMDEGLVPGAFDVNVMWSGGFAVVEFKGFDQRRTPGTLSDNQIEFGNGAVDLGHFAACFFTADAAITWLRECGAPVRERAA